MKKRYWLLGAYGLAGAALAYKLLNRPEDLEWAEHADTLPHAEHSRFVAVDGMRLHYQELGDPHAPPVLLLHGYCASSYIWSDVLEPLANAGLRVLALDLPGYGFSGKPRYGEYTIDAQARTVTRFLNRLGIGRTAIVGSSYGGAVAAVCTLDYPERIERLVLVDSVINNDVKDQILLKFAAAPVIGDLLSPLMFDSSALVRWRLKQTYAPGNAHLFDAERMAAHHRPLRTAGTHRAAIATLRGWEAERIAKDAHLIKKPTLIIWGEDDLDIPLAHGKYLHAEIPDSRLVVFRNCGHIPQEEYPLSFADLVADFCGAGEAARGEIELPVKAALRPQSV